MPQLDGIVPVNKPSGPASTHCLRAFKRQGQKKIGHCGTLDPMASGVLIVLLGQATKLSSFLLNEGKKVYSGTIQLGLETDTWDKEGATVAERPWFHVRPEAIARAVKDWENTREQEVPPYSAAKYRGQPLYKLARKGHDTPVKVKSINIYDASVLEISMPFVSFRVSCSSGSYIRSLAHSLGMRLECGATLVQLTREYSHPFSLGQCLELAEIDRGLLPAHVLSLQESLPAWPRIQLEPDQVVAVLNGRPIRASQNNVGEYAFLCFGKKPLAIAKLTETGSQWRIERGLWNT